MGGGWFYEPGETCRIMYRRAEAKELLGLIEKDDVIYLSNYKDGDKLKYQFEDYIYNDTEKNIRVDVESDGMSKSFVVEKGEICEFSWMTKNTTITYLADNIDEDENKKPETNTNTNTTKPDSNKENNSNKNTNTNTNTNTTKKTGTINNKNTNNVNNTKPDTTVATTKLPKTGTYGIIFISGFSFVTMMVIWVKLKKYEDVK